MECRVSTLRGKHRRTSIFVTDVRQQHRDEDQHRRRGDTDERVGRANRTTAHLARFGHDGRLELVERRVRGSAELLGGSTELLARRLTRRSVTRLTVLLLAGLAEGGLLALLRLATELRLALLRLAAKLRLTLLALLRLAAKLRLTLLAGLRLAAKLRLTLLAGLRLAEGGLLALLRLAAKLRLTLLALLRLAAKLRLTLLRSSAVLGLAEGGLLALHLSISLGRVTEGRLRNLLLGRRGRSGLVARGGFGLRRALKDRLLKVVVGGLGHGSLGLDVGDLEHNAGSLGLYWSRDGRLFDRGLFDGSLGLRFLVGIGERRGLLDGFLRGGLRLDGSRLLSSRLLSDRGLRGNDALICQPLPEGRVQRRVRCDVGTQVRASGSDIREVLGRKRRIAQVGSGELRRIDSAHLYSSRTRRCSS